MTAYKGAVNTGRKKKKEKTFFFSWKTKPTKTYALCGTVLFIIVNTFPAYNDQQRWKNSFFFLNPALLTLPKYIAYVGHFLLEISWGISPQKVPTKYRVFQIMWAIYAYACIQRSRKYWAEKKKEKTFFFSWKTKPTKIYALCGPLLFTIINSSPPIMTQRWIFCFFFLDPILRTSPKYIAHVGHFLLQIS